MDDGIHTVARHREGGARDPAGTLAAVGLPVLMTSLTTIQGFGSLVLARNVGLASLGWAVSIGVLACLVASFFPLAALLVLASPRAIGRPA